MVLPMDVRDRQMSVQMVAQQSVLLTPNQPQLPHQPLLLVVIATTHILYSQHHPMVVLALEPCVMITTVLSTAYRMLLQHPYLHSHLRLGLPVLVIAITHILFSRHLTMAVLGLEPCVTITTVLYTAYRIDKLVIGH